MAVAADALRASLDVAPTQEEQLLRESVAGICARYGPEYTLARLGRSAPVSREMVLNYVAEHSLRLPKSY